LDVIRIQIKEFLEDYFIWHC